MRRERSISRIYLDRRAPSRAIAAPRCGTRAAATRRCCSSSASIGKGPGRMAAPSPIVRRTPTCSASSSSASPASAFPTCCARNCWQPLRRRDACLDHRRRRRHGAHGRRRLDHGAGSGARRRDDAQWRRGPERQDPVGSLVTDTVSGGDKAAWKARRDVHLFPEQAATATNGTRPALPAAPSAASASTASGSMSIPRARSCSSSSRPSRCPRTTCATASGWPRFAAGRVGLRS